MNKQQKLLTKLLVGMMWLPIIFGIHNPALAYQVESEIGGTNQLDEPLISQRIGSRSRGGVVSNRGFRGSGSYRKGGVVIRGNKGLNRSLTYRGRGIGISDYGNCSYPIRTRTYPSRSIIIRSFRYVP